MNENRPKRRLKVDLSELEMALDNYSWEMNYYLDLETGRVILLTEETQPDLERLHDLVCDLDEQEIMPVEEAIQQLDLYEWRKRWCCWHMRSRSASAHATLPFLDLTPTKPGAICRISSAPCATNAWGTTWGTPSRGERLSAASETSWPAILTSAIVGTISRTRASESVCSNGLPQRGSSRST